MENFAVSTACWQKKHGECNGYADLLYTIPCECAHHSEVLVTP